MVDEIESGIGDTGVQAGHIGEIGITTLADDERRVLRAAARAALRTGVTIQSIRDGRPRATVARSCRSSPMRAWLRAGDHRSRRRLLRRARSPSTGARSRALLEPTDRLSRGDARRRRNLLDRLLWPRLEHPGQPLGNRIRRSATRGPGRASRARLRRPGRPGDRHLFQTLTGAAAVTATVTSLVGCSDAERPWRLRPGDREADRDQPGTGY